MTVVLSAIVVAAVSIGTLAASVGAGMVLMQATLRALEATVPRRGAANVTDFGAYVRRSTQLATSRQTIERAA